MAYNKLTSEVESRMRAVAHRTLTGLVISEDVAVRETMVFLNKQRAGDSHIYCEVCGIAPMIRDYMPANERNDHAATDLMCAKCHLIIATIHHLENRRSDAAPK